MNSRVGTNNSTDIINVFSQMTQNLQNLQNISNLGQGTIGNLSILSNMANLQNFPNKFGNLNKFLITPRDSVANSATNTTVYVPNNTTSNGSSEGISARNLSNIIGTSGTTLAGMAGLEVELTSEQECNFEQLTQIFNCLYYMLLL